MGTTYGMSWGRHEAPYEGMRLFQRVFQHVSAVYIMPNFGAEDFKSPTAFELNSIQRPMRNEISVY